MIKLGHIILVFCLLSFHSGFTQKTYEYIHPPLPRIERSGYYTLEEQRQLSWVLKKDTNAKGLEINTRKSLLTCGWCDVLIYTIDSVYYIPDSIIYLQNLEKLSIEGGGLSYISPKLSELKKLSELYVDQYRTPFDYPIPVLPYVKELMFLLSGDSISTMNVLHACPNIEVLDLHIEFFHHNWNVYNMFKDNNQLKEITIRHWDGLKSAEYDIHYYTDETGKQVYFASYFIDLDISNLKHLRKIITNNKLSKPMQKYCRRHFIRVVPFSRRRGVFYKIKKWLYF